MNGKELIEKLNTNLDMEYNERETQIDVYSDCRWTAVNQEQYEEKEAIINIYDVNTDLYRITAWCDISGYEYWVIQQEEENYVSIDVHLKKDPSQFDNKDIEEIKDAILEANEYFLDNL